MEQPQASGQAGGPPDEWCPGLRHECCQQVKGCQGSTCEVMTRGNNFTTYKVIKLYNSQSYKADLRRVTAEPPEGGEGLRHPGHPPLP